METDSIVPKVGFSGLVLILGNEQKNGFKGKMHLHKVKYFAGGNFFSIFDDCSKFRCGVQPL